MSPPPDDHPEVETFLSPPPDDRLSKKKLKVMGLQLHTRRAMQRVAHAARTVGAHARTVATHAMHGIDAARPAYEMSRPMLHHLGVNTAIADKALSHYDGIRRALGK